VAVFSVVETGTGGIGVEVQPPKFLAMLNRQVLESVSTWWLCESMLSINS
jgi:hypothetical protein